MMNNAFKTQVTIEADDHSVMPNHIIKFIPRSLNGTEHMILKGNLHIYIQSLQDLKEICLNEVSKNYCNRNG